MIELVRRLADYTEELADDLRFDSSRIREAIVLLVFAFGPWFVGVGWMLSLPLRALR